MLFHFRASMTLSKITKWNMLRYIRSVTSLYCKRTLLNAICKLENKRQNSQSSYYVTVGLLTSTDYVQRISRLNLPQSQRMTIQSSNSFPQFLFTRNQLRGLSLDVWQTKMSLCLELMWLIA